MRTKYDYTIYTYDELENKTELHALTLKEAFIQLEILKEFISFKSKKATFYIAKSSEFKNDIIFKKEVILC